MLSNAKKMRDGEEREGRGVRERKKLIKNKTCIHKGH